jgi:hypothetical protein
MILEQTSLVSVRDSFVNYPPITDLQSYKLKLSPNSKLLEASL